MFEDNLAARIKNLEQENDFLKRKLEEYYEKIITAINSIEKTYGLNLSHIKKSLQ